MLQSRPMTRKPRPEQKERLVVGDFTIYRYDESSVWIKRTRGEGGQFSDALFEAAIAAFYDEHF